MDAATDIVRQVRDGLVSGDRGVDSLAGMAAASVEERLAARRTRGEKITVPEWVALAVRYAAAHDLAGAQHAVERMTREHPHAAASVGGLRRLLSGMAGGEPPDLPAATELLRELLAPYDGVDGFDDVPGFADCGALAAGFAAFAADDAGRLEDLLAKATDLHRDTRAELWGMTLYCHAFAHRLADADDVLARMSGAGLPATAGQWAIVVLTYGAVHGFAAARTRFDLAVASGVSPNEDLWAALAWTAAHVGDVDAVARLIDEADTDGVALWNMLLLAQLPHRPAEAEGVFTVMESRGIEPDAESWRLLAAARLVASDAGEALAAAQRAVRLASTRPAVLLIYALCAEAARHAELSRDALERLARLFGARGMTDYAAGLRRLRPLLGDTRTDRHLALLDKHPGRAQWPEDVFANALSALRDDYGTAVPVAVAFPELIGVVERPALRFVVMRLLTPTQRARAAQVLGFDVEDTEWRIPEPVQRELAARFGDGDLLATRTESELVAAAERGDFDAAYYLRALALARGDEEQADHWLARARQIDPLELETRSALMWARLHPDDREGSAARLMSAVAKGSPSALFGLGVAAYQRGRRELAERLWERAAELGSNDALVDLAVLHGERGDLDQAIRWATTASERGHPAGFELRAHIAEVRHRDDEAEPLLLRALELGSTKAVPQLAALRIRQGRHDEAVEVLVSAAGRGNADAAHLLAVLSDSPSDEHRWLRRAAELGHGRAAGSLGLSLIGPDHALEAELLLRKAVRLEEPVGGAGLAALYLGLGEVGEAERWFAWTLERGDEEAIETALAAAHHMGPPGMFERWQQTARQA